MSDISQDILQQAAKGDIEAFRQVYEASSGFVYNVAFRITRNPADAEEAAQDVFMKVYRNLKKFQFRSAFKTWLYRITVNTAINRYHQSARQERGRVEYDDAAHVLPAKEEAPEAVINQDNEALLNKLLGLLKPRYKACFVLRELEGLSYREIAASLRIPLNTVRSRLKRARQCLLTAARKGEVSDAL